MCTTELHKSAGPILIECKMWSSFWLDAILTCLVGSSRVISHLTKSHLLLAFQTLSYYAGDPGKIFVKSITARLAVKVDWETVMQTKCSDTFCTFYWMLRNSTNGLIAQFETVILQLSHIMILTCS